LSKKFRSQRRMDLLKGEGGPGRKGGTFNKKKRGPKNRSTLKPEIATGR